MSGAVRARPCTPRCGCTRPPSTTSRRCVAAARSCSNPRPAGSPAPTPAPGRLPEPEEITTLAELLLDRADALPYDLAGVKVLVTAGGTREPIDPVRFIGNRSSGKQGYAMARVAAQRGADVTLIAGNTAGLVDPAGVDVVHIGSAAQLRDAVSKHAPDANVLVMAAAVADFRPAHVATSKIKKSADAADGAGRSNWSAPTTCSPVPCAGRADGQLPNMRAIVGFAAETGDANGDVLFHARAKLHAQGLRSARRQRRRRGPGIRGRQQRRLAAGGRRHRGRAGARFEDTDGQPYRGRDRGVPAQRGG